MTAKQALQKRALRRFAAAVKGLPIPLHAKCEAIENVLYQLDFDAWLPIVDACEQRTDHRPADAAFIASRKDIRWLYRNLLRACGVDSRHV